MVNVNNYRNPAIYGLHSGDGRYAYVGSTTKNSKNRLYEHNYRARIGHTAPVYVWMREVGIENVQVVDLAPIPDGADRGVLEASWIARLVADGHPLTNRIGRDGVPNSISAEMREYMGKSRRGLPTWIKGKKGIDAGWSDERRSAASAKMKLRYHQ